jgi:hypothetical protein
VPAGLPIPHVVAALPVCAQLPGPAEVGTFNGAPRQLPRPVRRASPARKGIPGLQARKRDRAPAGRPPRPEGHARKDKKSRANGPQARPRAAATAAPRPEGHAREDKKLVGSPGLEPGTYRLKVRCSTN